MDVYRKLKLYVAFQDWANSWGYVGPVANPKNLNCGGNNHKYKFVAWAMWIERATEKSRIKSRETVNEET